MKTDEHGKILSTAEIVRRSDAERYRRELNRARWGFVIWIAILCVVMLVHDRARADSLVMEYPHLHTSNDWAASSPRQWYSDIRIDVQDEQLRPYIEYAAWQWSQRTGKRITVAAGAAPAGYSTSGKITAGIRSVPSMAQTQTWHYMSTGNIAGAVVSFDPLWMLSTPECVQHMVTHEIGHAIGGSGHTASPHDVMFPTQQHCRYALSAADVAHMPYDGTACHVELMQDGSLYIPSFQGHAALLKKDGDGWRLAEYAPATGCTTVAAVGMDLTFGDIRSQSGNFRGWLRYVGGERWVVGGAE